MIIFIFVLLEGIKSIDENDHLLITKSDFTKDTIQDSIKTINERFHCPMKPKQNYIDLSDNNYEFNKYKTIYGCNIDSLKRLNSNDCSILIYKCSFQFLVDSNDGGAIYLHLSNDSKSSEKNNVIEKCQFNQCSANKGGAIYISSSKSSFNFDVIDNKFANNKANQSGGGIYFCANHGNILYCHFLNNVCSNQKGCDITFDFSTGNSKEILKVNSNVFEHFLSNNKIKSMFYFIYKETVDFNFIDNKINVSINSKSDFYVFDCLQSNIQFIRNLKFDKNCIFPSDLIERNIKSDNFNYDIGNPFTDSCTTEKQDEFNDVIIYDNGNERCKFASDEEKKIDVIVLVTNFTGFKQKNDDGGAIHIINCGLECKKSYFYDCISFNGGGGAIYYSNSITNYQIDLILSSIQFQECKAIYGGAIYIYSISKYSIISVDFCSFISNDILQREAFNMYQLYGGSSIFLTTRIGSFINCSFNRNKGDSGSIKIYGDFEKKSKNFILIHPFNEKSNQKSILIINCSFKEEESRNSIYFINRNIGSPVELINCSFIGTLNDDHYYIEGFLLDKNSSKIFLKSCFFKDESKIVSNSNIIDKFWITNATKILNDIIIKLIVLSISIELILLVSFHFVKKKFGLIIKN